MNTQKIISQIQEKLQQGVSPSPFLFVGNEVIALKQEIATITDELRKIYQLPHTVCFEFAPNAENIKLEEIKSFLAPLQLSHPYPLQIFIIHSIGNFTLQAANSCLKVFEELPLKTVLFLSNPTESGIIDTILSRVQIVYTHNGVGASPNLFYQNMIEKHFAKPDSQMMNYFFRNQLSKEEYIDFLQTFLLTLIHVPSLFELAKKLEQDLIGIHKNNVNPRYIVDYYLLHTL